MLTVRQMACLDGPSEEYAVRCVQDEEVLTQLRWPGRAPFRDQLRTQRSEREASLLRGSMDAAQAIRTCRPGRPATRSELETAAVREVLALSLRQAGFAVVHTSRRGTRAPSPLHVSAIWPDSDPLDYQEVPWPPEAVEAWRACFNG
jgi:hypothetical protein